MSIFIIFSNIFVIVQIFYNIFIQISFLSLNISKLFMVKVKRGTILSAMSHRSLELIASPSMATAFVIPSSVPSPMSPATPNVTSSFATSFAKSDYALRKFVHNKFKSEREANYRNSLFQKYFLFYLIFIFFTDFLPKTYVLLTKSEDLELSQIILFASSCLFHFLQNWPAPPSPTNIYEQSASISASSSFIMGTTPTSPKNIHPHASPSCSSLSPTFQIPNSKFQIRPPSSSPTFQIQATTDSLSHILFQEAPQTNTPDISVNIL